MSELIRLTDATVFDLEDSFARARGVRGNPRPLGKIEFRLVGRFVDGARQDFANPLEMIVRVNNDGYHLFFGQVRTKSGVGYRLPADETRYVVRIESGFYQTVELDDIRWPRPKEPYRRALHPGFAYPFPRESSLGKGLGPTLLRGALLRPNGKGIAGAKVEVTSLSNEYVTDGSGQWVLFFSDSANPQTVTVTVTMPGAANPIEIPNVKVVQGRENGLALTALSGRVTAAGGGVGGAKIGTDAFPDESETRSDGIWFYYFPLNQAATTVAVTARLPDGRSQTQPNIQAQPRKTTTVPVFQFS
jgi:hypothetical protein